MKRIIYLILLLDIVSACGTKMPTNNPERLSLDIYKAIEENNLDKYIELVYYGKGTYDSIKDIQKLKQLNSFLVTYGIGDTSNISCNYFKNLGLKYQYCSINFYCDSMGSSKDTIAEIIMVYFASKNITNVNLVADVKGLPINTEDRFRLFFRNTNLIDEYQVVLKLKEEANYNNSRVDTTIFYQQNYDTALTFIKFKKELYDLLLNANIDTILPYQNPVADLKLAKRISIETVLEGTLFGNTGICIESYIDKDESDYLTNFITVRFNYDMVVYLSKETNTRLDSLMNNAFKFKGIY